MDGPEIEIHDDVGISNFNCILVLLVDVDVDFLQCALDDHVDCDADAEVVIDEAIVDENI